MKSPKYRWAFLIFNAVFLLTTIIYISKTFYKNPAPEILTNQLNKFTGTGGIV